MNSKGLLKRSTITRIFIFVMLLTFTMTACKKSETEVKLPADFQNYTVDEKMEYVMTKETPDSVARFVINASLGRIPGVELDLNAANLYALDNYQPKDAEIYSGEYTVMVQKLPLREKMKYYYMEGFQDSIQVGYHLGLEYLTYIRENKKNVKNMKEEVKKFKEILQQDTATYRRFLVGLKIALENDRGVDLDEDIYNEFINYDDTAQ